MYIKVWGKKDFARVWTYHNFKEDTNATQIEFNTSGNLINYIIYEIKQEISQSVFDEYGFEYEVLCDYTPNNNYQPISHMKSKERPISNPKQINEPSKFWWQEKD